MARIKKYIPVGANSFFQKKEIIIMKKLYIHPCTKVVMVNVEKMIALSQSGMTFDEAGNGEIDTQNENAIGDAMSRSGIWDDDY